MSTIFTPRNMKWEVFDEKGYSDLHSVCLHWFYVVPLWLEGHRHWRLHFEEKGAEWEVQTRNRQGVEVRNSKKKVREGKMRQTGRGAGKGWNLSQLAHVCMCCMYEQKTVKVKHFCLLFTSLFCSPLFCEITPFSLSGQKAVWMDWRDKARETEKTREDSSTVSLQLNNNCDMAVDRECFQRETQ